MLTKLYRKYVSQSLRNKIYDAFLGDVLFFFRNLSENIKAICIYLFQWVLPKTEENRLYAFMGKHGLTAYPYPYSLEHKKKNVVCYWDEQQGMYYVQHNEKKLYFPIINNKSSHLGYRNLLTEQDPRSAHQYVKDYRRLNDKVLLDIGAAEGIFTLNCIEFIEHAYLFECDEVWIKALNATFAPWKDKVTIVPMYVSDINDGNNITVDHFLEGKDKTNLFLKMDIEGYEQSALKGASNTLNEAKNLDYSICTYHRKNDAEEINKILSENHFESEFTDNFLYFEKDFRKAIIRKKWDYLNN